MIVARRVYLYGIAFAAIWMLVNGLAGLLDAALEAIVEAVFGPFVSIGGSNLADRVSFNGALTGIGLVTWLIHWGLASRTLTKDPHGESRSALRKLYLYGFIFVGGLVVTFELHQLVQDMLSAAFGIATLTDLITGDVLPPLAMLMVTGAFGAYHWHVTQRDRAISPERGAAATIRRWCCYGLAFVGLNVLLFGAAGILARLIDLAAPTAGTTVDSGRWLAYEISGRAASVTTGLLVWVSAWTWSSRLIAQTSSPDPERDSVLRKVYLYGVLLIAVGWTVWNAAQALYVLLRSILIPSEAGALWSAVQRDLGETVANLLVFGVAWAFHAHVVRREAVAAPERQRQATIRWIYGYIVALVGGTTFAIGVGGTLATMLDLLVNPGLTRSEHWWEERLSLFATMIVVGLPVWLIPWFRLQREVVASVARRSLARRIYLYVVLGITVLTLLGTGAYALYQILRVVLGERWTASDTSDLIDAASAAAVAGLMLAYHLRVFQRDANLAKEDEAASPPVLETPTPLLVSHGQPAPASAESELVTLLVVRPPIADDAQGLRERVQAALPAGTRVNTVQVAAAEAARLLEKQA